MKVRVCIQSWLLAIFRTRSLAADSNYAPAYDIQGLVYSEMREFESAEKSFKHALDLTPNDFDVNHNYGWYLCNRQNRPKDAVHYFMVAVKNPLYQTPEKSLVQAGLCSLKAGDLDAADDYLHQADRIVQDDPTTLIGLANLGYARGEYANSRMLLKRVSKIIQPTPESLWLGIRVERKLGGDELARLQDDLSAKFPQSDEARKLAKGQFD
jgi:type IV pilus assembly protein PilF